MEERETWLWGVAFLLVAWWLTSRASVATVPQLATFPAVTGILSPLSGGVGVCG